MLKAKIPVIKEYYKSFPKESDLFTDASKAYIDSFLQSSDEKTIMLKIFSIANPWIKFSTNIKLVEHGFLPITSVETLELVLTGSVVFNYYLKNVYESTDTGILSTIRSFFSSDDKSKYANINGISDMIGELIVICQDSNRFEQIERFALDSIIEYYDFVGGLLDKIYSKGQNIIDLYLNQNKIDSEIDLNFIPESLDEMKKIMSSPIFTYSYKMAIDKKLDQLRPANIDIINNIFETKEKLGIVQNMFTVFPYYYYLIKTASNHNLKINVDKYMNNMKAHIEYYLKILTGYGIYSSTKKSQLFSSLIDVLSKYPTISIPISNLDRNISDREYTTININIPSNLHTNNLIVRSKPDKYKYNTQNAIQTDKSRDTKNHSIIIDQTFGKVSRFRANIDDIDTAKLVLNIDYSSIVSFRCEIFNIKIKRFYDTSYGKYLTLNVPVIFELDKIKTSIHMKNSDDIMNELFRYIFDENEFLPWNIKSMSDILYRTLLLLKINHIRTLEQIYVFLNSDKMENYKVFFDFDYDKSSFLKLVWINQTNNKNDTIVGQELLRFILITKELNKLDATKKQKIIHDFSVSYGTIEPNLTEYDSSINKFYTELNSVLKTLLELA